MMDIQQQGILTIIKSALSGQKYDLPEGFDFEAAARLAKKHQITALFYYGALQCGVDQSLPEMQKLFEHTCQMVFLSKRQAYEIDNLFKAFDQNKIDYLPLKGTLLKNMYPKTEMRVMSDADILIRTEQYEKIRPIMVELGYSGEKESNHEFVWNKSNVFIELHKFLIPSYNKDYYKYYGDGWQLGKLVSDASTRYAMSAEDEMIYLFTHFAKHYRDAGVGIKHIVDLWVYKSNVKELDNDYIIKELKKLQLDVFYKNVMNTLEVWFNNAADTEQTKLITQIIFNSGVYGTYKARVLSEAVKSSKNIGTAKKTKFIKVLHTIFLPYNQMILRYSILKKIPVLLPIMWVVRWFEAVFVKENAIKSKSQKLKIMSVKNISNHQEALNFVGLDFNFKE